MSHGNSDLRLDNPGYIMLQGYNNCAKDSAISNGSGKSGIWDALSWCLTGSTIRGSKDVVNHEGADGALVKLDLSVDNDEYTIIRTREHSKYKTNLKLYRNGEDISGKTLKNSETVLTSLLPDLTASLLGSVIILGQGMPNKFTNNTPSGRKAILEGLSKSDFMIAELKDVVGLRYSKLSADLRIYEDNILQNETLAGRIQAQLDKCRNDLDELYSIDINEVETEINNLMDTITENDTLLSQKRDVLTYFNECIVKSAETIANTKVSMSDERVKIMEQYAESETALTTQIAEVSSQVSSLNSKIREYENIKDRCPTCNQKLPNVVKFDTSSLRSTLADYNIQLASLKDRQKKLAQERQEDLNNSVAELQEIIREAEMKLSSQKEDVKKVNCEITQVQTAIQKAIADKEKLANTYSNYNDQVKGIKRTINELEKELDKTNKEVMYNKVKADATNERIAIVKKMETYLQRDFRGALLQNVITFINEKAKVYASQVFHTTNIEVKLDGNNIEISYNGKEYTSLSGGEQKKVDIIVQLAIRQMLITYLNFSCNCLVMDEIFDALDTLGCERITDLLMNELKDAGTVFLVSHRKDLPLATDGVVTVVKNEEGISTIIDK